MGSGPKVLARIEEERLRVVPPFPPSALRSSSAGVTDAFEDEL